MKAISVQISVYPLRQAHLGPAIETALQPFRARSLDVRPGTMSTVIAGDSDEVFDALKTSFEAAAALGDVVMVASISNCCPARPADARNDSA
jgi:uncharacterized protein YqgV (UPF0045/DUF77 family)